MAASTRLELVVEGLGCRRGERVLFQDLSFTVGPGELLLVRGPNGAGKSSLLRGLAGLLPIDGHVGLAELDLEEDSIAWHRQIAWLGHLDGLQSNETAREAIALRSRLWMQAPADLPLGVETFADRPARSLSAGQKRRAALAGVIASRAGLWLLDEPTTGLDAASMTQFKAALDQHLAAGGMAVIVTHDAGWEGKSLDFSSFVTQDKPAGRDPEPSHPFSQSVISSGDVEGWAPGQARGNDKSAFGSILARDLRFAFRQGGQILTAMLFFILVVMLLAFGVGPDAKLLQSIAPGAVWVAALLSCLLSLENLFGADHETGVLDMLKASPLSLEALALAKMLAHWLATGLPLVGASLGAALLLHLPLPAVGIMLASLLLGTPVLSLLGGAIAALLLGARRGSLILTLLLLPLYIPVLIFGAAAIQQGLAGGSGWGPLGFVAAMLAVTLPLAPIAAAAALEE